MNLITISRGAAIGGAAGSGGGASGADVTIDNSTVTINVDWTGAAIGGGGYDSGNDAKGGTLNYKSGSIRTYIDVNAVGGWGVDAAGVNGNKAITADVEIGGKDAYLLIFDTSTLSKRASSFSVLDGGDLIYDGGLHEYRYVNESRQKSRQLDISYIMDNWDDLSDSNLYLYLTGEDHALTVNEETFKAAWDSSAETFTVTKSVLPGVSGSADTATKDRFHRCNDERKDQHCQHQSKRFVTGGIGCAFRCEEGWQKGCGRTFHQCAGQFDNGKDDGPEIRID